MWRTPAIREMVLNDVARVSPDESSALAAARRRCRWVIALDWAAILLLVLLHDRSIPQLTLGGTPQTVFTLGILAVAVHSGFRLGQLEKLSAVEAMLTELESRHE